jgi:DNA-3-methyladenine glycosylase I
VSWYCDLAPGHPVHNDYHEREYGFPVDDDQVLFERQCLEIFQAGLSWELILKRRAGLNAAFDAFDPRRVAAYGPAEVERLLHDPRIIRNRRKVEAIIENARRLGALRDSHGSFAAWIAEGHPLTKADWVKRFRKAFVFQGGEVVGEFLMSIGYLPGSHRADCPVQRRLSGLAVPYRQAEADGFVYG